MYVFAYILDVRYNDDHTGQALLDHTNKYFDALTGLHAAHPSSAIGGFNKVDLSRWCWSHAFVHRHGAASL